METQQWGGGADLRVCKRCGRELPIEQFSKGRYGVHTVCKECVGKAKSEGRKKSKLANFSKEELLAELERRGLNIMASPTPRELMLRLKKLGYEGELKYVETHVIKIKDID